MALQLAPPTNARTVSITAHITVAPDHPPADDPLASQRLALIGRVVAAQLDIEKLIAGASGTADTSGARSQLAELITVRHAIATAGPDELRSLRQNVTALVARAEAAARQAQADAATRADAAVLEDAAAASRRAVSSAMDYARTLDLRFASSEEERAYREREAERRPYMAQQPDTPAGNLNAAVAAVGQMADAHAQGAHGPEFDKRWRELVATTEKLREAAKANGVSTEEFDRRLREDLRAIMKAKGLSDAQIDARFGATPDPLEAAKAFVTSGDEVRSLSTSIATSASADETTPSNGATPGHDPVSSSEAMARLRSAGVVVASATDDEAHHGVTFNARPTQSPSRSA